MKLKAFSVSEVASYLDRIIGNDPILFNLRIKGEISNLKFHKEGNIYFSIKESDCKMNCIIFSSTEIPIESLKDGNKVVISGRLNYYKKDGSTTIFVKSLEQEGLGELYKKFLELKSELEEKGLFDSIWKKEIPKYPKKIGIVTSPTGAVIQDIKKVIERRNPSVEVYLYPVSVQGEKSIQEICEGIEYFNKNLKVDTLILARGGGSLEEIWSFNEKEVAMSIFESQIPIISAIGHETDYTISDLVSDLRASTPSVAAELAVMDMKDMRQRALNLMESIEKKVENLVLYKTREIEDNFFDIENHIKSRLREENLKLEYLGQLISKVNPLLPLEKGYAVVKKEGKSILSVENISLEDIIKVRLIDGEMDCKVEKIVSQGGFKSYEV